MLTVASPVATVSGIGHPVSGDRASSPVVIVTNLPLPTGLAIIEWSLSN